MNFKGKGAYFLYVTAFLIQFIADKFIIIFKTIYILPLYVIFFNMFYKKNWRLKIFS